MESDPKIELENQAELDPFSQNAKSSVRITKNSRGINWVIKVVTGEEKLIGPLMISAVDAHKDLISKLDKGGK